MALKKAGDAGSGQAGIGMGCCQVESVVTVDGRGQLVLPKEVREKAGIQAGDKLAVVTMDKGGKTCCIALIRAESFAQLVKGFLGPVMKDVMGK